MAEMSEKQIKAKEWADGIVQGILDDNRPFIKRKDSRPIIDLRDMLRSSVEMYGDNIAYLQKWTLRGEYEPILFKQVLLDVNSLGTSFVQRGLLGKKVGVIGPNCYQWCSVYLAVTCGVGCIVPLDKELNKEELKQQIIRAEIECICFDTKHQKVFEEILAEGDTPLRMLVNYDIDKEEGDILSWKKLIEYGKDMMAAGNRDYLDAEIDSEEMCVLLFTSGTTGTPKGVMLNHRNLCSELMISPTIFDLTPEDRYMSFLPLHHTYECTACFLMSLYTGSSVAFCQGLKYLTKNFQEVQPTMMLGVPALFEKLYSILWKNVRKQGKEKTLQRAIKINNMTKKVHIDLGNTLFKEIHHVFGGKMKTLICGGAKIDPAVLEGLRDFGFNAFQGYGLTEAAPLASFNPQDAPIAESVGVPLPNQAVKVIDTNDEGIGEVCIKGPNIMMGYYNNPEETAKVIDEDGWFHTGDLGYIKDGYTYLTGRAKNVIITKNGKNVYPEVIEYYLGLVPFIEESFVFEDKQERKDDTCIVAAIKVDEEEIEQILGKEHTDDQIRALLQEEVGKINADAPAYRRISKIILRKTDFIHNTTSKLVRHAEENRSENA